jgi:hypothetical protein
MEPQASDRDRRAARQLVIVGRNGAHSNPSLVVGPYASEDAAGKMLAHLRETTSGLYVVLPIHSELTEREDQRDDR